MRWALGWLLVLAAPAAARAQEDAHAYTIEATLDPGAHTVTGSARIRWTNESLEPAHELFFHLYLNAFESKDTVFMRESGGELRGDEYVGEGSITVSELRLADGTDLLAHADDALMEGDRTQMRVLLADAVPPGGTIVIGTRFVARLPPVFARSGYHGSFHMVAQWFPKLARRERNGTWVTFPYHGHGEFYADFARYDLTVTTPEEFVVGATGEMIEERFEEGSVTRRFVAQRVHDTVFCAWEHFRERVFEVDGVRVRILHPPGYDHAVERHAFITRKGLEHFGRLFGAYPYPVLTVVVPPRAASGAAGMEYPTLFLAAGSWFAVPGLHIGEVEATTAHELAHQWFQGMIATNEVKWPMLDEGLTQWATGDLLGHLYGPQRSALDWADLELGFFEVMRVSALRGDATPPPGSPAYAFRLSAYGRSVYARTAVILETVRRVWGAERFERAMGTYAREQRFGHPDPGALFDAFDRAYWRGFSAEILAPALLEGADADMELVAFRSSKRGNAWLTEVEAQRSGALPVPTTVTLRSDDGTTATRIEWPGDTPRFTATHSGTRRIEAAELDAEGRVLLDTDALDNTRGEPPSGGEGIFARLLFLTQQLLSWVGP